MGGMDAGRERILGRRLGEASMWPRTLWTGFAGVTHYALGRARRLSRRRCGRHDGDGVAGVA